MRSKIGTLFDDAKVLQSCPEYQSIPLKRPDLAMRVGGKVIFPQNVAMMIQNLPVPNKEERLEKYMELSRKTIEPVKEVATKNVISGKISYNPPLYANLGVGVGGASDTQLVTDYSGSLGQSVSSNSGMGSYATPSVGSGMSNQRPPNWMPGRPPNMPSSGAILDDDDLLDMI